MKEFIEKVLFFIPHFKSDYWVIDFYDEQGNLLPFFPAKNLMDGDHKYRITKMQLFRFMGFTLWLGELNKIISYQEYKELIKAKKQ